MTSQAIALLAVIALLVAAATAVLWPLRQAHRERLGRRATPSADSPGRIARDAKLAEISDLELDYRLGKLSAADYQSLNAALRAEAVEILRELDAEKS
jgi:hypothetical protein